MFSQLMNKENPIVSKVDETQLKINMLSLSNEIDFEMNKLDNLMYINTSLSTILSIANENPEKAQIICDTMSKVHSYPIASIFGIYSFETDNAVEYANEGFVEKAKEFIIKIYNSIKAIFKKFIQFFKKVKYSVSAKIIMIENRIKRILGMEEFKGFIWSPTKYSVLSYSDFSEIKKIYEIIGFISVQINPLFNHYENLELVVSKWPKNNFGITIDNNGNITLDSTKLPKRKETDMKGSGWVSVRHWMVTDFMDLKDKQKNNVILLRNFEKVPGESDKRAKQINKQSNISDADKQRSQDFSKTTTLSIKVIQLLIRLENFLISEMENTLSVTEKEIAKYKKASGQK